VLRGPSILDMVFEMVEAQSVSHTAKPHLEIGW
jgi:hypothetical protein